MRRRNLLAGLVAAALLALPTASALAQGAKIVVGYTVTADFASGFIAMDQGLFKKRGLDVEYKLVPLNSQLPAASSPIRHFGVTTRVRVPAGRGRRASTVRGRLGSGVTGGARFLRRCLPGCPDAKARDFTQKVGAPGFGAFLHVLFRNWLSTRGGHQKCHFRRGGSRRWPTWKSQECRCRGRVSRHGRILRPARPAGDLLTDNLKGDLPSSSIRRPQMGGSPRGAKAF